MTYPWTADELSLFDDAHELEIAVQRTGGSRDAWTPIWVVSAGGQVYVRSWHRRDTGWFGHAVESLRARVRVPGLESDVLIKDIAGTSQEVTASVDAAYRAKYGQGGAGSMVTPDAAQTTLKLARV
ncbi:DUF2255 family protein [soil metagenome]